MVKVLIYDVAGSHHDTVKSTVEYYATVPLEFHRIYNGFQGNYGSPISTYATQNNIDIVLIPYSSLSFTGVDLAAQGILSVKPYYGIPQTYQACIQVVGAVDGQEVPTPSLDFYGTSANLGDSIATSYLCGKVGGLAADLLEAGYDLWKSRQILRQNCDAFGDWTQGNGFGKLPDSISIPGTILDHPPVSISIDPVYSNSLNQGLGVLRFSAPGGSFQFGGDDPINAVQSPHVIQGEDKDYTITFDTQYGGEFATYSFSLGEYVPKSAPGKIEFIKFKNSYGNSRFYIGRDGTEYYPSSRKGDQVEYHVAKNGITVYEGSAEYNTDTVLLESYNNPDWYLKNNGGEVYEFRFRLKNEYATGPWSKTIEIIDDEQDRSANFDLREQQQPKESNEMAQTTYTVPAFPQPANVRIEYYSGDVYLQWDFPSAGDWVFRGCIADEGPATWKVTANDVELNRSAAGSSGGEGPGQPVQLLTGLVDTDTAVNLVVTPIFEDLNSKIWEYEPAALGVNIPSAPTNFTATIDGQNGEFDWDAVAGADGYYIYADTGGGYELLDESLIATNSYSATELPEGDYDTVVVAVKDGVESAFSNVESFTVEAAANAFTLLVKSDNTGTSNDDQFTIPTADGPTYNYNINWYEQGNESNNGSVSNVTGSYTITFGSSGTYIVKITGVFPWILFIGGFGDGGDKDKILEVQNWGEIAWSNFQDAFRGCTNLRITATDTPDLSSVTSIVRIFQNCTTFNGDIGAWNVSSITNMYAAFDGCTSFNQDLGNWNFSSATNMTFFMRNVTLSSVNYDSLLVALEATNQNNSYFFNGGNSQYTSGGIAETARTALINDHSVTITDGGAV